MESLITFKKFVDEIQQNNSRNYKLEVLKKWSDNPIIRVYLDFIYNPYKITGISEKKLYKEIWMESEEITSMYELMDYLLIHNTGRDEDICKVQQFKDLLDVDYYELFDAIITKSLTLGVDVLSINKCMGNYIPTFSVQLANKYFDKPEIVEGKAFALTRKIDGSRIIAIKENGEVTFYTRQGQLYEGLVDLEKEMLETMPDNICLDGELTILDANGLSSKDQYKACMKISRKDGIKHGLKMLVFDCMNASEFKNQFCNRPYKSRRQMLVQIFRNNFVMDGVNYDSDLANLNHTYFEMLPILYEGEDTSKITEILNEQVNNGEEGIMINILDAGYEFKRTNSLLKVKVFNSCDLRVINLEEGSGKNQNSLGAFICEYKDNVVKVGTGISDEIRKIVWNDKDKYINTIIEVSYFEETENQNGTKSLRFPTFKDFRPDKSEPNY